jgi:hypothetical protein
MKPRVIVYFDEKNEVSFTLVASHENNNYEQATHVSIEETYDSKRVMSSLVKKLNEYENIIIRLTKITNEKEQEILNLKEKLTKLETNKIIFETTEIENEIKRLESAD